MITAGSKDQTLSPVFEAFENMRTELKENNSSRNRFLMAISYDLKTPLISIKGYVEALEDGLAGTKEKQSDYLAIFKNKSDLLEQRIGELIEFAKMEKYRS